MAAFNRERLASRGSVGRLKGRVNQLEQTQGLTSVALDEIDNPTGNTSLNMSNKQVKFTWTAPQVADGAFELEASGGFTGDLLHIHQHTGNVGSVDLLHVEAADSDACGIKVSTTGTSFNCDNVIQSTLATGTAPFTIASTTMNTNLNAEMLAGKKVNELGGWYAASTVTGGGNDMDLIGIEKTTGAVASVEFSSIDSGYMGFDIKGSVDTSSGTNWFVCQLNGDSGANYKLNMNTTNGTTHATQAQTLGGMPIAILAAGDMCSFNGHIGKVADSDEATGTFQFCSHPTDTTSNGESYSQWDVGTTAEIHTLTFIFNAQNVAQDSTFAVWGYKDGT